MTSIPDSGAANWRNLVAACAAISVFGFAFGMTYPLLSLILEARGVSAEMIGINAAMFPIGILLFSSMIPFFSTKLGARNTAVAAALVTAALLSCYKLFPSLESWFVIRLVQGMAVCTLFVLSEAWIVKFADGRARGRVVAIYASVLSASFGLGPAVVGWVGIEGWTPFLIGSGVVLLGIVPLLMVRDESAPDPEEAQTSSVLIFIPKAPVLLASVAIFAIFDAATLSLFPVYGVKVGLDVSTAANLLTALVIGNVVLQFPIGWLADNIAKRTALALCAGVTLVLLLVIPAVMGTVLMWPVALIAGASGYGMYTIALADLGDRFSGQELVAGTAAFGSVWGSGALIGSIIGGWAMAGFGPHGLPYVLALLLALYLIAMAVRVVLLRRRAV